MGEFSTLDLVLAILTDDDRKLLDNVLFVSKRRAPAEDRPVIDVAATSPRGAIDINRRLNERSALLAITVLDGADARLAVRPASDACEYVVMDTESWEAVGRCLAEKEIGALCRGLARGTGRPWTDFAGYTREEVSA
ncbi:MAG: hypothetical protein U5L04_02525 [Trueperaceae bacterium]|nr:hypothetical protein [Trueperaceae bacterium]